MNKRVCLTFAFLLAALGAHAGVFNVIHFTDQPGEWWRMKTAAQYGGWIGGGIGGLAGILGALSGFLVWRCKGRTFMICAMTTMAGVGMISLIAGIAALADSQPYHVTYPLLLFGIIMSTVCGTNALMLRKFYVMAELRQMSAKDA